jgi:hypothetical protein
LFGGRFNLKPGEEILPLRYAEAPVDARRESPAGANRKLTAKEFLASVPAAMQ